MPVESKMAVGFWQMQTFEMAVRKGGFVPGLATEPIQLFVLFGAIARPTVTTVMRGKCAIDRHGSRRQASIISFLRRRRGDRPDRLDLRNPLKLRQIFLPMVREPANDAGVAEQLRDIAARERQVEIVDAVAVLD